MARRNCKRLKCEGCPKVPQSCEAWRILPEECKMRLFKEERRRKKKGGEE